MGNQNTIQVTLTVKDDGSVVMQQFGKNAEAAMNKINTSTPQAVSALDKLKSSWLEITAAATGSYLAFQKVSEYIEMGAKAEQAKAAFYGLAAASGESADQILANMKRATDGTVDDSQLMQKAVKAQMLDLTSSQVEQIAEMARMAARISGDSVSQAFDNIINAISTNMPRGLKQYGLVTKEQMNLINQAMTDGAEGVNLMSVAWSNYNVQIAKSGSLTENTAEKIQKARAQIAAMEETAGNLISLSISNSVFGKIYSLITQTQTDAAAQTQKQSLINAAQLKAAADEQLKAQVGAVAQKKASLETMKALDKDYFKSQEDQIKATQELMISVGGDEYKVALDALQKKEALNAEYYTRTQQEIALEADARTKAEKDKVSNAQFTAEKMKVLDAEELTRVNTIAQQKTALSIKTAQDDIKNLTSRLGDYQKYYDSLKAAMDKNTADEQKHLAAIKALRQQSIDMDKSAAAQLALINGTDKNQTSQQKYESGRSTLNDQFNSALDLSGQDRIKALEDYRAAVTALQQQFANGVQGAKDMFGNPQDIISAAKVAEDASSDINRALSMQQSAVSQLRAEEQKQADADKQWGQVIQGEAIKAQQAIVDIQQAITDLSAKMEAMKKTIEIRGIDQATSVIDNIAAQLERLHDKTINITAQYSGGQGATSLPTMPSESNPDFSYLDSFAIGTDYVPRTGIYKLHQGEAVIPAAQNNGGSQSTTIGDVHIHIPANAAPQSASDWRSITRNYIVPELRRMQ
jgi:hypothetical protein